MDTSLSIRYKDWDYKWLDYERVPFAFSNWEDLPLRWVGFDDVRSFDAKVRYLTRASLGGAMVFSIDQDDPYSYCRQGEYPLLRVVNFFLNDKLNIQYPDANKLFDLGLENTIRQRDEQIWLENYMIFRDLSKNTSKLILLQHTACRSFVVFAFNDVIFFLFLTKLC